MNHIAITWWARQTMYWLNLEQQKTQFNVVPELNTRTCLSEKYNCSFTYCKFKTKEKSRLLFKENRHCVPGEYGPPSEKAWRQQNEQNSINNLDPSATKKPILSSSFYRWGRGWSRFATNLLGRVCVWQGDGKHTGILLCSKVPVEVRQPC